MVFALFCSNAIAVYAAAANFGCPEGGMDCFKIPTFILTAGTLLSMRLAQMKVMAFRAGI